MLIIDGENLILGRVGAFIAKKLIEGESVVLINSEKMFISGKKHVILEKYKKRRNIVFRPNPNKAPKWPKVPNMLVRRIIRGMIPYDSKRGREMYKKFKVYMGSPDNIIGEKVDLKKYDGSNLSYSLSVLELSKNLGYVSKVNI